LILNYHGVVKTLRPELSKNHMSVEQFEAHLKYYSENYEVIPLESLISLVNEGVKPSRPTVAITFDDGYENNFSNAFPLLKQYNFPATIFVTAQAISKPGEALWYDALDICRNEIDWKSIIRPDSGINFSDDSANSTAANFEQFKKRIKSLTADKKQALFMQLFPGTLLADALSKAPSEYWKLLNPEQIKELSSLAPLHNPANLEGIEVAEDIFPNAKQVAVFDTAFLQSIPEVAYKYAIPNEFLTKHHIRVYGFHGTSHKYVSEKAIDFLGKKESKIITIHLGNGCSMTAVKNGKSVDHSMGFSPLGGLIMGTRSGDIDPALTFYLAEKLNYDLNDINTMLLKKSGMLGLTGFSDLRDIESEAEKGNKECQLALQMNAYRIKKYIGSYAAVLNGLDAIVFTAGIGENSNYMRQLICEDLEFLGIELDTAKNDVRSKEVRSINKDSAKTKILVIPTNEELEIAKQAIDLIKN